jgi:SM-20-related protein
MTIPATPQLILSIVEQIESRGYAVIENFLDSEIIDALAQHSQELKTLGEMHKATTGLNSTATNLRGDFIYWIEETALSETEQIYFQSLTTLRNSLNQNLYLGLFELESHFAIYPPGTGYQKHLDQFIGKDERKISCILYLNEDWDDSDGGALRLYLNKVQEQPTIDIIPKGGTLVAFLSSEFPHEVLPAKRERMSITGWFKTRTLGCLT